MNCSEGSIFAPFTKTEQEIIVLNAVWELINDMVNNEMFVEIRQTNVSVSPSTITHKRLFNILLIEFLSNLDAASFDLPQPAAGSSLSDRTYLFYLKHIAKQPQLNPNGAYLIAGPVEAFVMWLEGECKIEKVWFPSIGKEANLRVKRIEFLRICGNIAKHNFPSMTRNAKEIAKILMDSGIEVDNDQRYLVIPEFYEWFHSNVLGYHISAIAEFLNNIRWGIYEYLRAEFIKSFTQDDPDSIMYKFRIPTSVNRELAISMYWHLMNEVRSEPYIPKFEVSRYYKMRY